MTRLTTMAAMPASTALACGDPNMSMIGFDRLRLLLRLGVATDEDIPKLTGLAMQIGEHLAQLLRFGSHLSRQRHAPRRGSLLQHLHERRPLFRRQLAQRLYRRLSVLVRQHGV